MSQSSNDVIPTAIHVAAREALAHDLLPALRTLGAALSAKAREFDDVVKIGRTHLQDATPIRLGQEFGGYARQVELAGTAPRARRAAASRAGARRHGRRHRHQRPARVRRARHRRARGAHRPRRFARRAIISRPRAPRTPSCICRRPLKTTAVALTKIANDIRWLGSGPRCGIGEITLPATQPGSSIMPGKVNPVMGEALCRWPRS